MRLFSNFVRRKEACALIGLRLLAAEGEVGSSGCQSLIQETCGDTVAQKAWIGAARARQVTLPVEVRIMSTTTSAGPLKSLGKAKRQRSFSRIGSLGELR